MFTRLELRRLSTDRLALLIPLRVRVLPALVAGWLLYALVGAANTVSTGPLVVALLLLALASLAALYDDRWIFDSERRQVLRRIGLLFAARQTVMAMADFDRVILRGRVVAAERTAQLPHERQRSGIASFAALLLQDTAGRCYRVEQCRGTHAGDLAAVAAAIASFCGLPLEDRTAQG
jgi:hypothetical protein